MSRRLVPVQLGVIPARYESQRFPGKPLVDILGKPMVVRTWEQAKKAASLDFVVVATDDRRIANACRQAGAEVVMTSPDCPNGEIQGCSTGFELFELNGDCSMLSIFARN